ncbi:MAG TPA: pyrroloquinoline-quinone synthase PqqC [Candidatus Binataceae bacterium]|nr:pyrroloquinoline-quinone synthase PqqC [Candidatus Binataceae bacterium]
MTSEQAPWSREEFLRRLQAEEPRYHTHHPFHLMMNEGKLSPDQIRGWVLNRFYYQYCIPLKDGAILSNCPDREVRRKWIRRIIEQDGTTGDQGGIEAWIQLGQACGIEREEICSLRHVLPAVRFAVDAYVNFARTRPWQESACSSLTEMFAPEAHRDRLASWPTYYPWIKPEGLNYFRSRLSQAQSDVRHGLEITLGYFTTRAMQQRAIEILRFKLDILWTLLDAVQKAYCSDSNGIKTQPR